MRKISIRISFILVLALLSCWFANANQTSIKAGNTSIEANGFLQNEGAFLLSSNHHTPSTSNISTKQNSIDASLCDSLEDDDDDDDDDKVIAHFKNNIKQGLNYLLGFYAPALASNTTSSNTIFKSNFHYAFQKQAKYLVFCVFRI